MKSGSVHIVIIVFVTIGNSCKLAQKWTKFIAPTSITFLSPTIGKLQAILALSATILFVAPKPAHCQSTKYSWRSISVLCIGSSTPALDQSPSLSERHCVAIASQAMPGGLSVAQFNSATQLCSTFSYQSVCRQLINGSTTQCFTFLRFPIEIRLISSKLTNLWLADDLSRLDNLVCQIDKDTNKFYPISATWTSEGLNFDGVSSYMILNKTGLGFSGGLTWLLRIRRKPQVQVYFEFNTCSTLGSTSAYNTHMWEYTQPNQVYVRPDILTGTIISKILTASNQLSNSANDWINIAFTTNAAATAYNYFYNGSFLAPSTYTIMNPIDSYVAPATLCVMFGRRIGNSLLFSGTLRALAFANSSMSETEIQQFYAAVT